MSRLFLDIQFKASNQEHRNLAETASDWLEAEQPLYHRSWNADRPFGADGASCMLRARVNQVERAMARSKRGGSGSG